MIGGEATGSPDGRTGRSVGSSPAASDPAEGERASNQESQAQQNRLGYGQERQEEILVANRPSNPNSRSKLPNSTTKLTEKHDTSR